jgi:diguanylate cyclase (GGDEF)-like protein
MKRLLSGVGRLSFPQLLDNARWRVWLVVFPTLLALGATFSAVASNSFEAAEQRDRAERLYVHTLEVLVVTGELKTAVHGALRGERGYLLTRDPEFLRPFLTSRVEAARLAERLQRVTADNPKQQQTIERLKRRLDSYLQLLQRTVSLAEQGQFDRAIGTVRLGLGKRQIEAVLASIHEVEAEEYRLLEERRAASDLAERQVERIGRNLMLAGVLFLILLAYMSVAALNAGARAARATAELRRLATTDELTGLANRAHFLAGLERETARAARNGNPLCLAILDVDHFKRINDLHGHPVGDEVLRIVARVLQEGTRGHDLVGRIGGEEFAILMPETSRDNGLAVCERLCKAMEATPIALPSGANGTVTFSTGVALLSTSESPGNLVSRADSALYEAKFSGRNRVKLAA